MNRRMILVFMSFLLSMTALFWGADQVLAQQQSTLNEPLTDFLARKSGRVTPSQQKATAANIAAARAAAEQRAREGGYELPQAIPPGPGDQPDYFTTPNWANTPPLPKFVDTLAPLGCATTNNLGQCIPIAIPDTTTYPDTDYYVIELVEYRERMHSYFPALNNANKMLATSGGTKLRGYRQVNTTDTNLQTPHYLGPLIIATKDKPVRVKFINSLPTGDGGKLFVPVDTSVMGAGEFDVNYDLDTLEPLVGPNNTGMFSQNRATLHLHGGRTPWISDGTPHQWITPAGESTSYPRGLSVEDVPDMPAPGPGEQTYFWTNNQSARLMFYHDHSWGITRLNVYVGEAAGYLIRDEAEQNLINAELIPPDSAMIPLIIQDKTFVDGNPSSPTYVRATDPLWNWGSGTPDGNGIRPPVTGDLWWPHVYMPAQNPFAPDGSGINAFGRWHYGPWFWPATPICGSEPEAIPPLCITNGPAPNLYYDPACDPAITGFCQPPYIPGTPDVSWGAEAFLDAMIVNGTAYPRLEVDPKEYRFRILNAAHDRFLNLQLYKAAPIVSGITITNGGSGYTTTPTVAISAPGGRGATATATIADGVITAINMTSGGAGYTFANINISGDGLGATATVNITGGVITSITVTNGGSNYTTATVSIFGNGSGAAATATITPVGVVTGISLDTVGSGYTSVPVVVIAPPTTVGGVTAQAVAAIYTAPTEVGMVPSTLTQGYPPDWPKDGREGGVPDPATSGPAFIQIATEGGFLPAPVLLKNQPVQWNTDPTMFNVGNVLNQADGGGTLFVGSAERVDVIVDFSQYAGQTLILYNDAPTAFPALIPQNDYYTGAPDRTDTGGAAAIPPGVAPNIRTVMQIVVSGTPSTTPPPMNAYNSTTLANLQSAFQSTPGNQGVFESYQDPIIVGQSAYDSAYDTTFPSTWPNWGLSRITDNFISFYQPDGNLMSNFPLQPKAIQDEMGETFDDYGRMSAKLGLTVPFANAATATFAVQNYVDPPTEIIPAGATQIWKITHNGVDTHPIHFHLFDVQLLNRVGWDGFIRRPDANELGWKDTVRISPLEDTIVALKPVKPPIPFPLPDSIRPLNPATPIGSTMGFSQIDPFTAEPMEVNPQTNQIWNFGWEYVWHCHILSHEENDMMRSVIFDIPIAAPAGPTGLTAVKLPPAPSTQVQLTWTTGALTDDNPNYEIGFHIERCEGDDCVNFALLATVYSGVNTYTDAAVTSGATYNYRVKAFNDFVVGDSAPSNVVEITMDTWLGAISVGLSANPESPGLAGTAVLFTASCEGNTVPCQYRFSRNGTIVKDFGSLGVPNTWILPATTGPGTYTIRVDVRTNTTDNTGPYVNNSMEYQLTGGVRRWHLGEPNAENTVTAAFANALNTDTIEAWGVQFNELPITFSPVSETAVAVTFSGGWNTIYTLDFPSNVSMTTLNGPLTIGGAGTLTVENLIIR